MQAQVSQAHQVYDLPLLQLYFSPTNPRQSFSDESIGELAGDIKKHGLMSPIIVRHNPTTDGAYEIVVGSRRTRAHLHLKEPSIAAFIKTLTDDEVLDMQFSENLQREDVQPLEEAQAFQYYLDSKRLSVHDIAARLNCSATYVYSRIRLNNLSTDGKELLKKGKLSLKVAERIAKFEPDSQADILKSVVSGFGEGQEVWRTDQAILQHIRDYFMTQVKDAPFAYQDPNAHGGSCLNCQKNTACNKLLFPEFSNEGRCTDRKCWELKKQEFRLSKIEEVKQTYGDQAVFLTTDYFYNATESEKYGVECKNTLEFAIVDAHTEGAIPAICLDSNRNRDDFPLLQVIHVIPQSQIRKEKLEKASRVHIDDYISQCEAITEQVKQMTDDELLAIEPLMHHIEVMGILGYFEYAVYYFKNIHKKHPYRPLADIARWQDEFDNTKPETDCDTFIKEKLKAYYAENRNRTYHLDHDELFKIHFISHLSDEDLKALIRETRIKNARRYAPDFLKLK
jgi:ParB/RepB/Spo0J family partition protein